MTSLLKRWPQPLKCRSNYLSFYCPSAEPCLPSQIMDNAHICATTTSTDEIGLQFTQGIVRGANIIKRSVYTLMLTDLANDVECNVVDPCRESRRLHPTQPAPSDKAVATAALFDHYTLERARSLNIHLPFDFWAGPEVLRAMAPYLREPVFVLQVNKHNDGMSNHTRTRTKRYRTGMSMKRGAAAHWTTPRRKTC